MSSVSPLTGPLLWTTELSDTPAEYTLALDASELSEIKAALDSFRSQFLGCHDVSPATFPLPNLGKRLTKASEQVHNGKGFIVVAGLNIEMLTSEESTVIYLALASYIGDKQGLQNKDGEVIIHVTDKKGWAVPKAKRHGIYSQDSLPFHCDMGADILSLQARACAETGGSTCLASAWSVYNDLAEQQPEALDTLLSNTWPIQTSGQGNYFLSPLMHLHDGKLVTSVDPARLGPHPHWKHTEGQQKVPELSEKQNAALKALDESARRNEIQVTLQKGDILFLNNWAIMHRRDSYKDGKTIARHLVRLWSRSTELGWKIPEAMALPWKVAYERNNEKVYKIDPPKEYISSEYTAGSAAFVVDEITR